MDQPLDQPLDQALDQATGQTVASDRPLPYKLLTGGVDRAFCEKVSAALDDGYELYGSPTMTALPDGTVVCAQAVVRGEGQDG